MNRSPIIAFIILASVVGCSDDTKTNVNNTAGTNNGASTNTATNNNDEDNNQTLGTWAAEFDGAPITGTSVQPFYSEGNDVLSLALQGGPSELTTLSIEIDGIGYGSTGKYSAATHPMRVNGGGTGFTCFSGDNSTFSVTFEEITCSSIAVCSAKGSFTGTLDCSGRGDILLEGSFQR